MDKGVSVDTAEGAAFVAEQAATLSKGDAAMESKLMALLNRPEVEVTKQTLDTYLGVYNYLCWIAVGAGLLLLLMAPFLKKWQHGVK